MTADNLKKIREKFKKYAGADKLCGFSAFLIAGDAIEQFCGGTLSLDNGELVNNETLFETGSLSKPITASLFAVLEAKGIIDPRKSIRYYLESTYAVNPILDQVKVAGILTHSSGLPRIPSTFIKRMEDTGNPYEEIEKSDLQEYLAQPDGLRKPGTYRYSNFGYGILAEIVKIIFNEPFDKITDTYLFNEVKMKRTGTLNRFKSDTNIATGHTSKNAVTPYWTGEMLDGAGSFLSTSNDMLKFLQLHMGYYDTAVSAAVLNTQELRSGGMGLGWHYKKNFLSRIMGYHGFAWHNGMTGGFTGYMAFHKRKRTGMLVLANKAIILDHWFYYYASFAGQ